MLWLADPTFSKQMKIKRRRIWLILAGVMLFAEKSHSHAAEKKLPLAGEIFQVSERQAFLIPATKVRDDGIKPWVWYAPTLPNLPGGAEKWMFEQFTQNGIAIAGIDVGESFGSPAGRNGYNSLYHEMTEKRGYSEKPILLARSRGGLMLLSWAIEYADQVGGFAGIYPVCNLASYPGIQRAAGAYELKPEELKKKLSAFNPVDRLESLAKAGVPFFAIHGDVDKVVPLEENSGLVAQRYEALGGTMELVVPKGQGHNMWSGFFTCQELVDFVLRQVGRR